MKRFFTKPPPLSICSVAACLVLYYRGGKHSVIFLSFPYYFSTISLLGVILYYFSSIYHYCCVCAAVTFSVDHPVTAASRGGGCCCVRIVRVGYGWMSTRERHSGLEEDVDAVWLVGWLVQMLTGPTADAVAGQRRTRRVLGTGTEERMAERS